MEADQGGLHEKAGGVWGRRGVELGSALAGEWAGNPWQQAGSWLTVPGQAPSLLSVLTNRILIGDGEQRGRWPFWGHFEIFFF